MSRDPQPGISAPRPRPFTSSLSVLSALALTLTLTLTLSACGGASPSATQVKRSPKERFVEAGARASSGDAAGALELYARVYADDPKLPQALYNIALLHERAGEPAKALEAFRRAAEAGVDDAWVALGLMRLEEGSRDEAKGHLLRALELNPLNRYALFHVQRIKESSLSLEEAQARVQDALAQGDLAEQVVAHAALGNAYSSSKDPQERERARSSYELAIKAARSLSAPPPFDVSRATAEALFKVASDELNALREMPFMRFEPPEDPKEHLNKVQEAVGLLTKEIEKVKQGFEEALAMNVETWGLAALSQMGELYTFAFNTLAQTPPPAIFDAETRDFFRTSMTEKAEPLRLKAVESYKTCLDKARELDWFDEWAELSARRLVEPAPTSPPRGEERAATPASPPSKIIIRRGLILALPEA